MAARIATERYCVRSNNGIAKCTTSKTFPKIKIKISPKCIGKKDSALEVRRTSGVTKRTLSNPEMPKNHQYNISHQRNIEEIQLRSVKR